MRFQKIAATQDEFPRFYKIAQILMCDLLPFFGIASTQDEFVLFDKISQNRPSFSLLFVQIAEKSTRIGEITLNSTKVIKLLSLL